MEETFGKNFVVPSLVDRADKKECFPFFRKIARIEYFSLRFSFESRLEDVFVHALPCTWNVSLWGRTSRDRIARGMSGVQFAKESSYFDEKIETEDLNI